MTSSTLANVAEVSDGGLAHLQSCIDTLDDDFSRVDQTICGLAEELNIVLRPSSETAAGKPESEPRSLIERATRRVRHLQERSDHQRSMVEQIRDAIR